MRVARKIELDAVAERELTALARRGRVEARVQQRARIVLLAAKDWQNKDIAAEVDLDRRQVALWRQRFLDGGVKPAYKLDKAERSLEIVLTAGGRKASLTIGALDAARKAYDAQSSAAPDEVFLVPQHRFQPADQIR